MNKKNKEREIIIIIAILIVVFIVVYVLTVGKINIAKEHHLPQEFRDSNEEAKRKHAELKIKLENDIGFWKRLAKKNKIIFFLVRLGFILLWAGYIFLLCWLKLIKDLGNAINYSQVMLMTMLAMNFLTFGTISNLNKFVYVIKIRIENYVFRKYGNLAIDIQQNKIQVAKLENEIKQM